MENVKPSLLKKIDPRNFNFTTKILLLTLGIVFLIMLLFLTLGLNSLSRTLVNTTGVQLQELTRSKATELELMLNNTKEELVEIANSERLQAAAEEFIASFISLSQDKYELFYETQLEGLTENLKEYYSGSVAINSPLSSERVDDFLPTNARSIVSQYLFILENPEPIGEKEEFNNYNDYSAYSQSHKNYHSYLNDQRKKIKAHDLFLVDPKSGYVVYSSQKNIDFGINLYESELRNSRLAEAFLAAISAESDEVFMSDFENYPPAGDRPVTFLSVPIHRYDQLAAIIIVQFATDIFDNLLYDDSMLLEESTLEYSVIGTDLMLRNNPQPFILSKEGFLRKYIKMKDRREKDAILRYSKTGNMAMLIHYAPNYKDLLFSENIVHIHDYYGNDVLACTQKLSPDSNTGLFLLTKINRQEVLKPFRKQLRLYLIVTTIILCSVYLVVRAFGKSFSERMKNLLDGLILLFNGEKVKDLEGKSRDELGATLEAYNKLRRRINNAEEFALEMSDGNYNYNFKILSDRDSLGKSLNILKDTLIKSRDEHEARTKEDEIRNWVNDGIAMFNDLLRENTTDIKILGYSLIENLIHYLDASVGGIFLVEGDQESGKRIELLASYAYDRRKFHKKSIEIGEGLLGACYLEKKSIYMKKIPDDYIEITSGLGHELPSCLYIVPLKVDDDVMGMIEIASFNEFGSHQIEFIDRVADSIAGTFVSVRLNMKTAILLEESNRKAEEIAQQEEEMRQNLEEMQATQEELARLRQDDEKRTREMQLIIDNSRQLLKNILDAIPGGYILKDQNGIIHLANAEGAEYYGLSPERVIGKTDHELLGSKIYQAEHKKDLEVLDHGEKEYKDEHEIKGKMVKYNVIKKPFEIAEISQMGVLTIRIKL